MLTDILKRACLTEVFEPIGIDYDEYQRLDGTTQGNTMRREFKSAYISFFVECLAAEPGVQSTPLNFVTKGTASALDNDFIEFVLSKEGQAILKTVGYTVLDENADPYVKKNNMSGTISIMPNTGNNSIGYIEAIMSQLTAAYTAIYPDVTFKIFERDANSGYNGDLLRVDGTNYTLGISNRDLIPAEEGKNLNVTNVA